MNQDTTSNQTECSECKLLRKIRVYLLVFIVLLILSGITAFPIQKELEYIIGHIGYLPSVMKQFLREVYVGIKNTNDQYPYIAYGSDWLAFAHLVIAVVFIGPLKDPVRNIWVIQFGIIACFMVFPLAFIADPIRQIPFYWQLGDCSFGIIGGIVLYYILYLIRKLELKQQQLF